jgi:hypothetical protein
MSKFKVGDIIKCVKYHDCVYVNTNLKKAKVLDINSNEMTFEILEHSYERLINIKTICTFENFEEYFELVDEVCGKNLFDGVTWKNDFYERYIKGIWENQDIKPVYIKGIKEEKEMNKVLNLWFERKQEKIIKKYAEMEQDFINNHYSVVKSYNELVEQFEKDLDDLYKFDKVNEQFVLEEISDKNTIKYDIDFDKLSCEFTDKHIKEKQGELKELAKIREEVEAQLSLSNELNYQQEVLIQYNIIDKKTKKIVE